MNDSKNKIDTESTSTEKSNSKSHNSDKLDEEILIGLFALLAYFGYPIEKAFSSTLEPTMDKLFNVLSSYMKNQKLRPQRGKY